MPATRERNGVRIGQRVRDLDGAVLGRVTDFYDGAFAVTGGFPILFRRDYVIRDDEVREVHSDEIVVARSRRDLFDLAAGEVPPAWRIAAPPELPAAATPPEARSLLEDRARAPSGAEPRPGAARARAHA